jgi:acyl phosphate:glycerol-3-phosphate acyltransferase
MLEQGLKILIAYLVGGVLGSLILGKFRGIDIRSQGSGNAGATNALRTQGKLFALCVLVIDIAKGAWAVRYLPTLSLPLGSADPLLSREWLVLACGLAVIVGHVYPVWFGFRGGKGAATVVGVMAALNPLLLVAMLATWFVVLLLTGFVSLATMLAGAALLVAAAVLQQGDPPLIGFCAILAAFIVFTHRSNITRLRAGNENRVRRLWLLRPRA